MYIRYLHFALVDTAESYKFYYQNSIPLAINDLKGSIFTRNLPTSRDVVQDRFFFVGRSDPAVSDQKCPQTPLYTRSGSCLLPKTRLPIYSTELIVIVNCNELNSSVWFLYIFSYDLSQDQRFPLQKHCFHPDRCIKDILDLFTNRETFVHILTIAFIQYHNSEFGCNSFLLRLFML